jgi:hypothetical protein
MTDPKIEPSQTVSLDPCPFCGSELKLNVYSGVTPGHHGCVSSYCPNGHYIVTNVAAHNQLCELVRFGKAAEKLQERPPTANSVQHDYDCESVEFGVRLCLDMLEKEGE